MNSRLRLDPIRCDGHGYCAEILPELTQLDDWGFPILTDQDVPESALEHARRAVKTCPVVALRLESR